MSITDGDFELLTANPVAGTSTWIRYNPDGTATLRKTVRWDQYLDANKEDFARSAGMRWGDGKMVSSVPMGYAFKTGYADAIREGDDKWKQRFLNDIDHRKFRPFEGKV
jgi:hypothetical protein